MANNFVIGISGKMGCGKNYIGEKVILPLLALYGIRSICVAFADYLKLIGYTRHKLSYEKMYYVKDSATRAKLQEIGDEEREQDINIFINSVILEIRKHQDRGIHVVIVTDVRFINEYEFIESLGICLRIVAPKRTEARLRQEANGDEKEYNRIKNHKSEWLLDETKFKYEIHNDEDDVPSFDMIRDIVLRQFDDVSMLIRNNNIEVEKELNRGFNK